MRRAAEEQHRRRAEPEHEADPERRLAPEVTLEHRVERALVAEHGGREPVRGGAVAPVGIGQRVERVVERAVALGDLDEQREGSPAGRIGMRRAGRPPGATLRRLPAGSGRPWRRAAGDAGAAGFSRARGQGAASAFRWSLISVSRASVRLSSSSVSPSSFAASSWPRWRAQVRSVP